MKTIISAVITGLAIAIVMTPRAVTAQATNGEPGAEIHLTGVVEAIEVDTCMDGATHILVQARQGKDIKTRLKPKTDDLKKQLESFSGKKITVTVTGIMGSNVPECDYLEIDSVAPATDAEKQP